MVGVEGSMELPNNKLCSLGEGECFVCCDAGEEPFGVLHVGKSIFHQLKQHPKQNFLLCFGIDPDLLELTQDPNKLAAIIKSFILVEHDPHLMDGQYEGLQLNNCKVVDAASTRCVANNRVYPVQSVQSARSILSMYTVTSAFEWQGLPFVVAVQADPNEDDQDLRYLGKGISTPSKFFTVLVRDVKSAGFFDHATVIGEDNKRVVGIKGTYDIWGSSADENSRGSLVLYWDCDASSVSAPLQAPSHTGPKESFFLLKGSSESEQLQEIQDFDRELGVLVKLYNCSTGAIDLSDGKEMVSPAVSDSADWEEFVKAFIDSSGAVTRSQQQRPGDGPIPKFVRTDKDFTEAFWETVVCDPNATPLQVLRAVRDMSRALHQGTLLPLVSKTNHTFFGEYCRRAIAMEKERSCEDSTPGMNSDVGMSEHEFRLVGDTLENVSSDKTKRLVASKLVELGCFVVASALTSLLSVHTPTCSIPAPQTDSSSATNQLGRLVTLRDTLQLCTTATVLNCPSKIVSTIGKTSLEAFGKGTGTNLRTLGGRVSVNPDRSFPYFIVAVEPNSSWLQECCKVLPRPVYWRYSRQHGTKLEQLSCVQPGAVESLLCTTRLDTDQLKRTMAEMLDILRNKQTCKDRDIPNYVMRANKVKPPVGVGLDDFEVFETVVTSLSLQ